jgi:hypothetical protein
MTTISIIISTISRARAISCTGDPGCTACYGKGRGGTIDVQQKKKNIFLRQSRERCYFDFWRQNGRWFSPIEDEDVVAHASRVGVATWAW